MHKKICPKCGSTKVKIPPSGSDLLLTIRDYCQNCKNSGLFPEIKEEEVENFRKKLKKNSGKKD